jgi:NADPH:quinone reductase-like Zn-dependent oxidoreductase
MKAVVHDRYGPPEVLRIDEVERPEPAEDQVLVKVHATTVNRSDCGWRGAKPFFARYFTGLRRPKRRILGSELAGEVAAVGPAVTEFEVGDRVFGVSGWGANAAYVCVRQNRAIAPMPNGLSFEEAAAVCDGAILALQALRLADPGPGKRVLVYGASGSIGTAGVQLVRHFGAHVTAVCRTKDFELVRSLGADELIDYTKEDFTKSGELYDAIFDAVGKLSFLGCRGSLKPGGVYLPTDGWLNIAMLPLSRRFGDRKARMQIPPRYGKKDVLLVKELIEAGEYRPVVDRVYPLEQVVEATKYVETGEKVGNVVLTVDGDRP